MARHGDGYKTFRADVLKELELREDRFGIEPEITAKVCRRKLRIYEIPISCYGRSYGEGRKITWRGSRVSGSPAGRGDPWQFRGKSRSHVPARRSRPPARNLAVRRVYAVSGET